MPSPRVTNYNFLHSPEGNVLRIDITWVLYRSVTKYVTLCVGSICHTLRDSCVLSTCPAISVPM